MRAALARGLGWSLSLAPGRLLKVGLTGLSGTRLARERPPALYKMPKENEMNADIFAQLVILGVLLLGLWKRDTLYDLCDGNVERLELEDRAEEARWWLRMIRMNSRD